MNTTSLPSQVFLVVATQNADKILSRLEGFVGETDMYKVDSDKWVVSFSGTSRDLAEKAGIRGDDFVGSGLVLPINSYSGRSDPALWEWLNLKMK